MPSMFGSIFDKTVDSALGTNLSEDDQLDDQAEVETDLPTMIFDELTEVPKTVGLVRPVVLDPQDDLATMTPLLGVLKTAETKMIFKCPDCRDETHHPLEELDLDADCTCQECEHEGLVGDFYTGEDNHLFIVTTTRYVTDAEIGQLLHGDPDARMHSRERERINLKTYFAMLHGHQPPAERHLVVGQKVLTEYHCDTDCQRRGCTCVGAIGPSMLGRLKPMPVAMIEDAEDFDDDDDDDFER